MFIFAIYLFLSLSNTLLHISENPYVSLSVVFKYHSVTHLCLSLSNTLCVSLRVFVYVFKKNFILSLCLSYIYFIYIYIFLFLFFLSSYCFLISNCPSSIQHWDSNSQPSDYESPPLTTRPGRLPIVSIFKNNFYIYLSLSNTMLHICANPYVSLCICL